jgi:hypothetical protein
MAIKNVSFGRNHFLERYIFLLHPVHFFFFVCRSFDVSVSSILVNYFFIYQQEENTLGNPHAMDLLRILQPTYWFAGHMHVKFAAMVKHQKSGKFTKFLALSKVYEGSDFLHVITVPDVLAADAPKRLSYDAEWLAIVAATLKFNSNSPNDVHMPSPATPGQRYDFRPDAKLIADVIDALGGNLDIAASQFVANNYSARGPWINPQTATFNTFLANIQPVVDKWIAETNNNVMAAAVTTNTTTTTTTTTATKNPDEIELE